MPMDPIPYTIVPIQETEGIAQFHIEGALQDVVEGFGKEWKKFHHFSEEDLQKIASEYFDLLEGMWNPQWKVLDAGCGSGRFSLYLSRKVGHVEAVDASIEALLAARQVLRDTPNVRLTQASLHNLPFPDESFDLIVSLGVLHHIPDTEGALAALVKKLKKGGILLIYVYHALDNKGFAYKALFRIVDAMRRFIAKRPYAFRKVMAEIIAWTIYVPVVSIVRFMKIVGLPFWRNMPLAYYVDKSLYVIRNDALDRFGTSLEKRFTRQRIEEMLKKAGLEDITFSEYPPYWHVRAIRP